MVFLRSVAVDTTHVVIAAIAIILNVLLMVLVQKIRY